MALKTQVKVGNITNLSDARYCAGMGVDMLGYAVVPGRREFIKAELYQEIRGWISGPAAVAELYGLDGASGLHAILDEYRPDYLETDADALPVVAELPGPPLIVSVDNGSDLVALRNWKDRIAFVQVSDEKLVAPAADVFEVLLLLKADAAIPPDFDTLPIQGIALTGGDEIRPGYKDYDELAKVLEALED